MKSLEQEEEFWLRHLSKSGFHMTDSSEYRIAIQEVMDRIFGYASIDKENMYIVHRNLIFLCEELGADLPDLAIKWKERNYGKL